MKARKRSMKSKRWQRQRPGVNGRYEREEPSGGVSLRFLGWIALVLGAAVITALAAAPEWWATRNVLAPEQVQDNHAAVTVGQIKNLAVQAKAEMDVKLALDGGAGPEIDALVAGWYGPGGVPSAEYNSYAAATVGQLKAVARPFYDRLMELGLSQSFSYPWPYGQTEDDNALVNAGQVKHVFSFEIPQAELGPLAMSAPFYQQKVPAGQLAPFGARVLVTRKGRPISGITVTFEVMEGGGGLASNSGGTPQAQATATTDGNGAAICAYLAPAYAGYAWVQASAEGLDSRWMTMIIGGGVEGAFPTHPPGRPDITFAKDTDGDSFDDADELAAGSDPDDANSEPQNPTNATFQWKHTYKIADLSQRDGLTSTTFWESLYLRRAPGMEGPFQPAYVDGGLGTMSSADYVLAQGEFSETYTYTGVVGQSPLNSESWRDEWDGFEEGSPIVQTDIYVEQSQLQLTSNVELPQGHKVKLLPVAEIYPLIVSGGHHFPNLLATPEVIVGEVIEFEIPKKDTISEKTEMPYFDPPTGKFAILSFTHVDLDIVHPAAGELDERQQHDITKGGYVAVKRDNKTPVTKLVIRRSDGLLEAKFRMKFNEGDRFKLWKDAANTQAVVSEQTEFDPGQETSLYFEGLKESASICAESLTLQVTNHGTIVDVEKVYITVVEAEFDVWLNVFIPTQWGDIPISHPIHWDLVYVSPIAPNWSVQMRPKIFSGDDRSYVNDFLNLPVADVDAPATSSRSHSQVVIIPFKELDADGVKDGTIKHAMGVSHNYLKSGSVPNPAAGYSLSNRLLPQQ